MRTVSWTDVMTAVATAVSSLVVLLGASVGLLVGARWVRRADVGIEAEPLVDLGDRVLLPVRIRIRSVGLVRLSLLGDFLPRARVIEVLRGELGPRDGATWVYPKVWPADYIEPGETVSTTVTFWLPTDDPVIIGWRVVVEYPTVGWIRRWGVPRRATWFWDDNVFVGRPTAIGSEEPVRS